MDYVRSQLVDYIMREQEAKAAKAEQGGYEFSKWDRKDVETLDMHNLLYYAYGAANYFGESQDEINLLKKTYEEQEKVYNENNGKITDLTTKADQLKKTWDLADAAYQQATSAALAMADRANSFGVGEEAPKGQAKGDWYVPYDNYPSLLHRGEMVLTASQARQYRDGAGGNLDVAALTNAIVGAVQEGLRNAHIDAYLDGRRVTNEVSRIMNDQMMLAR